MSTSSSSSSPAHTRLSHVTSHLGIGIGIGIGIPVTSTSTSTLLQSHDTSALSLLPSKQSSLAKAESLMLERSLASFSVQSMTDVLFGSRATAQLWDRVSQQQERDAVFASDSYDLEPIHHREQVYARVKRMLDYKEIDDPETYEIRKQVASLIDSSLDIRLAVHYSLFAESVLLNGTTEQLAKWKEPILSYKLPGCFAMTELGHGSYVQGFETTATFDREKDEFIIHTPTDTATKWWIGGAAHSALVAVVYARLIIDKKDYGVYNFFVPLRRRDNFSCLPGVTVGDIGAKMGRHGIDNGWLQFTHVRIPRENMLMRWAKVDRNGKFEQSPSIQLSYGALIPARVGMAKTSVLHIKRALIIAIRYAAVRRQFPSADPTATGEQQLLDYATHMMRLMPLLAETYAIHFACKALDQHTRQVQAELAKGDARNLNDLHGLSAGMKAFTTWFAHEGIDICRQSCGGHGYSAYTGLGMLSYDFAVNCTWEGDNTVMALQSARALVKSMNQALSGKKVTGVAAYLATYKETLASRATFTTAADLRRSTTQLHFLTYIATKLTHGVTQRMNAAIASGETSAAAWNNAGVSLRGAAKAHIYLYIARTFVDAIDQVHDENVRAILHDLCDLFTIYHIRKALATLLEDDFISGEQSRLITSTLAQCCRSVRSQAIPLVDSFHYSDDLVRSPLGRYDGNVYEAFFLRVKNAPESQSRPFYWETFIKPNLYRHQQPKDPLEL